MYIRENPVLQRELLVNLRMPRGFVLLGVYQLLLATVVYFAWPQQEKLDLTENPESARRLVDLFFLGQYMLASMMAPTFAAAAITGEKERQTYEMLLASPLRPAAIVLGKMIASLTHLAVLLFCSLPIVVLCLPLGGVSPYEVFAAYLGLIASVVLYGMISIACSSYFKRTAAALVVSYLVILPLAMLAVLLWNVLADYGIYRFWVAATAVPAVALVTSGVLFANTCARLLYPPDVGSEGQEVIDLEKEAEEAVGLVIQRDQFPDKLFAPPKRETLMEDGVNPVYDKEIHSEIFSQGTLMLRVVIQVSTLLAFPLMAFCLYYNQRETPWYVGYVLLFNMLVGPVFNAGSVTSERERQTLDMLLTTIISPWQILFGKLLAGLRVSSVLTMFLLWPLVLAAVLLNTNWPNWPSMLTYGGIVLLSCLTTALVALFCSVVFRKTAHSLLASYLIILMIYALPLSATFFATRFFPDSPGTARVTQCAVLSPLSAVFEVPLKAEFEPESRSGNWTFVRRHAVAAVALDAVLFGLIVWMFRRRWRVAE